MKLEPTNRCLLTFVFLISLSFGISEEEQDEDLTNQLSLKSLFELETISVASFFENDRLDLSATATVITPEEWRRMGARNQYDVMGKQPGIQVYNFLTANVPVARGYARILSTRGHAVILDGVSLNQYSKSTAMYFKPEVVLETLKKIETIRGSGSSLYGADAFHGVFSMTSWDADEDTIESGVRYGSFGYHSEYLRTSHAMTEDFRFNFSYQNSYLRDRDTRHRIPETDDRHILKGKFNAKTINTSIKHENFEIGYVNLGYEKSSSVGIPVSSKFSAGHQAFIKYANTNILRGKFYNELSEGLMFEYQVYYWDNRTSQGIGMNPGVPTTIFVREFREHNFGHSLLLKRPFETDNWQWAIGYSYDKMHVDHSLEYIKGTAKSRTNFDDKKRHLNAIYAQSEHKFFDEQLLLILGYRIDHYTDFGSHNSPRATLIYKPTDNHAIKLIYGHAFRAPSASEQGGSRLIEGGKHIKPEEIDNYELVFEYLDENIHSRFTLYNNTVSEVIEGVVIPINSSGQTFRYQNAGESRSKGVEIEMKSIWDDYTFFANGSYVYSVDTTEYDHDTYSAFPRYIVNWGIDHRFPDMPLEVSLINRHQIHQYSNAFRSAVNGSSNLKLHDTFRSDLHIEWKFDHWLDSCYLNVSNILDRDNTQPSMSDIPGGVPDPGIAFDIGIDGKF